MIAILIWRAISGYTDRPRVVLEKILCIYIVCQILVFNPINIIVTDMEGNIRIDRLSLDHGTDNQETYKLPYISLNIVFIALKTRI
jgi:hypothetical protein